MSNAVLTIGVHISELPKFLLEDTDESTHSLWVLYCLDDESTLFIPFLWVKWPVILLLEHPQLKNARIKPHILIFWCLLSGILNLLIDMEDQMVVDLFVVN